MKKFIIGFMLVLASLFSCTETEVSKDTLSSDLKLTTIVEEGNDD